MTPPIWYMETPQREIALAALLLSEAIVLAQVIRGELAQIEGSEDEERKKDE